MIVQQVQKGDWEPVRRRILADGISYPECLQVDVKLTCNGTEYILRVQPDTPRKIIALQATEVTRSAVTGRTSFRLIGSHALLASLLDLLIYQSIPNKA